MNPNSQFSAEDPLADQIRMEPQEFEQPEPDVCPSCGDEDCDGRCELQDEQPYDGWEGCWPGDRSGMDDFEDFNQNEAMDYCDE